MVKKLVRFFAYVAFFLLAFMYFAPKISIYYFLEQQAKPFGVLISNEKLEDSGFGLNIKEASLSFKSIETAVIGNTDINLLGLYNGISLEDIILSTTAESFVPLKIYNVDIVYSIFNPLNVKAYGSGEFGEAEAAYNIVENSVTVKLLPSKKMTKDYKGTLRNLKKQENGEYVYDQTF